MLVNPKIKNSLLYDNMIECNYSSEISYLDSEAFLRSLIRIYGKHTVYSDGGSWYPEACISLGLKHRLHS